MLFPSASSANLILDCQRPSACLRLLHHPRTVRTTRAETARLGTGRRRDTTSKRKPSPGRALQRPASLHQLQPCTFFVVGDFESFGRRGAVTSQWTQNSVLRSMPTPCGQRTAVETAASSGPRRYINFDLNTILTNLAASRAPPRKATARTAARTTARPSFTARGPTGNGVPILEREIFRERFLERERSRTWDLRARDF